MIFAKLRQIFIDINNYRDTDNQCNRINVGTDKLLNDIPIQSFDITKRIDIAKPCQPFTNPFCHELQHQCMCNNPLKQAM